MSGMLIYICSADKYRRLTFPVEWIQSIFVIVFDANAKRVAPLLSSKPFLFKDDDNDECKIHECGKTPRVWQALCHANAKGDVPPGGDR